MRPSTGVDRLLRGWRGGMGWTWDTILPLVPNLLGDLTEIVGVDSTSGTVTTPTGVGTQRRGRRTGSN